jgi:hypothetical protein
MAGQLTIDSLKASTGVLATQNGMTGIAKAWVNYNGTTQTISGSFNVSSVTYISTGQCTVNFTTAMPNANYATAMSQARAAGSSDFGYMGTYSASTTSISLTTANTVGTRINFDSVSVSVLSS